LEKLRSFNSVTKVFWLRGLLVSSKESAAEAEPDFDCGIHFRPCHAEREMSVHDFESKSFSSVVRI